MNKVVILFLGMLLFSSCIVLAADNKIWYGRNESNPTQMIPVLLTSTGVLRTDMNFSVADIWNTNIGQLTDANSTQFENIANALTIKESWLNSFMSGSFFRLDGTTPMEANANFGFNDAINISTLFTDIINSTSGSGIAINDDVDLNNKSIENINSIESIQIELTGEGITDFQGAKLKLSNMTACATWLSGVSGLCYHGITKRTTGDLFTLMGTGEGNSIQVWTVNGSAYPYAKMNAGAVLSFGEGNALPNSNIQHTGGTFTFTADGDMELSEGSGSAGIYFNFGDGYDFGGAGDVFISNSIDVSSGGSFGSDVEINGDVYADNYYSNSPVFRCSKESDGTEWCLVSVPKYPNHELNLQFNSSTFDLLDIFYNGDFYSKSVFNNEVCKTNADTIEICDRINKKILKTQNKKACDYDWDREEDECFEMVQVDTDYVGAVESYEKNLSEEYNCLKLDNELREYSSVCSGDISETETKYRFKEDCDWDEGYYCEVRELR